MVRGRRSISTRLQGATAKLRRAASDLRSPRRTALREVVDRPPPPPSAFFRFGVGSWIVPPTTVVVPQAVAVGAGVVILEHADIRVVGRGTGPAPRLEIGDGVRLTRFVSIVCEVGVVIEDGVASSDCITVTDSWRDLATVATPAPEPAAVRICRGAYLGYGCTIGPGVTVGAGAFVGEGAVVIDDVPAHTVVYGNPATVIRRYDAATASWIGPRWP